MSEANKTGFRDVKEEILERLRDRTWGPGDLLPREIALAEEFGCARTTVNRALRELSDEGLLERKRKAGTRVRMSPLRSARFEIPLIRDEIEASGSVYRYRLVSQQIMQAPDWLCARLDLGDNAQVAHVRCMHFSGSAPYQFEDRWINCGIVPEIGSTTFEQESPNEWLVREVPFSNAEISFFAAAADTAMSEFLQVQNGEAIFASERATWREGNPVTLARMYFQRGYRMTTYY